MLSRWRQRQIGPADHQDGGGGQQLADADGLHGVGRHGEFLPLHRQHGQQIRVRQYSMWRVDRRNGWVKTPTRYPAKRKLAEHFQENFYLTTSGISPDPAKRRNAIICPSKQVENAPWKTAPVGSFQIALGSFHFQIIRAGRCTSWPSNVAQGQHWTC